MTWMIAIILQGQLFLSNERFLTMEDCEKERPKFKPYICMAMSELKPDQPKE